MTRHKGYYWVKTNNTWLIALYQSEVWFFAGDWHYYEETHFDEIDEHRIQRKEAKE